ncbi:peptide ABC transporter substrate-binding protein [Thermobispora bispora]|jgi:peptide/nickel transport system substrate-binding protein|uniref:Extracellular solute-binding protein family 5 n=2 Tax=Thermobispora bispora TaxID=2006 RepID=D6Y705_THEBD|nr:extracellular solute-binding protein family 5 [Thermobispora bispora DSM 43833]MBO2475495.1 ABC transporter substrate-binding protein [Actinomycetales bacterium]MBX6166701.1 ABC transporter substrate-binding protein [Thermobispora bispora]
MRWHKRLLAAGAVVAMALTATACAGGQVRGSQSPAASGAPTDATFVYVPNLEVVTEWDPASSYSNEIIAMHNIYETLTRYNPQTKKAEPLLATSWTSSDEGKKWTFTLRQGVTFHTGKPLDAKAAKAAIERTKKIGDGAAYIWDAVDKIEAKDDFTLEFKLKYPVPLDLVASSGYAAFIYDTTAVDGDSDDLKKWFNEGNDAGTGPYTVESWRKGEEVELTLKAYDQYWGGWDGPHYKKVSYRVTPEITTAWQLLQRGEVSFVPRLNPQLFAQAGSAENVQTSQTPSFQNLLLLFNTASGPLKDVRLRKAIQKAIDYDGLLAALQGSGVAASGFVPEGLLGHVPGRTPKQDLAGAEALLKEAGYGPGGKQLELELTYAQGDNDQQVLVTLLSSTLDKLNVKLSAKALQWNTQWDQGKAKDPEKRQDIFVMYWWPDYADAYSWFFNVFRSTPDDQISFNLSYLKDKKVDEAIDGLPELMATDPAAAEKAAAELQAKIIDEHAAVAVPYVVNYQRAYAKSVQGYVDNPAYPNVVFVYDLKPAA